VGGALNRFMRYVVCYAVANSFCYAKLCIGISLYVKELDDNDDEDDADTFIIIIINIT